MYYIVKYICYTKNNMKKRGRPKLDKSVKKSYVLPLRLSEKELLKLKEISANFGGNISNMIRFAFKKAFEI